MIELSKETCEKILAEMIIEHRQIKASEIEIERVPNPHEHPDEQMIVRVVSEDRHFFEFYNN